MGKIPTWARVMHAGNGDRKRLPQTIDWMKGDPILAELYSMGDVKTKRATDEQEKANTPDPTQLVRADSDCVCIFLHWPS